ncbi:MAG: glutamate racemase [Saccharofermentanales bacterium]|jgi:glutamate racemase
MCAAKRPIGIFDSGLGGLTVLKEINKEMPGENTVYFGDSGRTPYGNKSPETIVRYTRQIVRFLQEQQVKLIVIACNTVSACAADIVRDIAGVPVVEVVTPGAEAAVQATNNRRIGVIGTRNTITSEVYIRAIRDIAGPNIAIFQRACPMFVSLAEEGWWDNSIARAIAAEYLTPLIENDIDTLLLGCTHYPLLVGAISWVTGPAIRLINAGRRVADQVRAALTEHDLINPAEHPPWYGFYTSDSTDQFQEMGSAFLKKPIDDVKRVNIELY